MRSLVLITALLSVSLTTVPLEAAPDEKDAGPAAAPKRLFLRPGMPPPTRIEGRDPIYDLRAKEARVAGRIILLYTIGIDGKVRETKVLKDLPVLGEYVGRIVRMWKFKPYLHEGSVVELMVKQDFVFIPYVDAESRGFEGTGRR